MCKDCCTFKKFTKSALQKLGVYCNEEVIVSLSNAWDIAHHLVKHLLQTDEDDYYNKKKQLWDSGEFIYGNAIPIENLPNNYYEVYSLIIIEGISAYQIKDTQYPL